MKKTTVVHIALFLLTFTTLWAQKSNLEIPPNTSMELDYLEYKMYRLQLKNNTGKQLEVKVRNKVTGDFVRGFGLGPLGKVEVMVEQDSKIIFTNNSGKMGRLAVKVLDKDAQWPSKGSAKTVSFTLVNSGATEIPLLIPNVMNPNLSPLSNSGVDLKMGQEILFRKGLKKYVLLTVDETIEEGEKIDVSALLKARKKELGLK